MNVNTLVYRNINVVLAAKRYAEIYADCLNFMW